MKVKINKVIISAAAAAEIKGAATGTAPMLHSEAEYQELAQKCAEIKADLLGVRKLWADMAFESGKKDRIMIAMKARLGIPVETGDDDTLAECERIAAIVSGERRRRGIRGGD